MTSTRLPLPAALLARRSRNAKSALERHHNAYYAWEVSIRLAAAAHIPATIAPLRRGTLGEWRRALGECRARTEDEALRNLFSHFHEEVHGTSTERTGIVLAELLDLLVAYRNRFIGHGSVVQNDEFYVRGAELLQSGLEHAWNESLFLAQEERVRYVEAIELSAMGRATGRVFDLDRSLPELIDGGKTTLPDGIVPRRVYCVRGLTWTSLHPWVFHDPAAESMYCFNGLGRRALYLDYASGKEVSGPELDALCPGIEQEVRELFENSSEEDPSSPTAARADSMHVGRYEVLGKLGQGGMGAVYLARQDPLGRLVALKVLPEERATDPVAIARFQREIAALARCDHPNVVKILDAGQALGLHYYAMEFVEGADLSTLGDELSTGKSLAEAISSASDRRRSTWKESFPAAPELPRGTTEAPQGLDKHRELASFTAQVARGLDYLHSHHVVHRDVKPSNLMAAAFDRRAVVMDLGVALLSDASQRITLEQGPLLGTIRYMSPEQVQRSILQIDHRSDVYSLGVSLYELLTGRPYVLGDTEAQLIQRILFEEPRGITRADGVPRDLARIVWKATRKNPDERYGSAALMATDLEAFVDHRPISVRRRMPWYVASLFVRRRPMATGAALLATAIAMFATREVLHYIDARIKSLSNVHAGALEDVTRAAQGRTFLIEARALESAREKAAKVANLYLQAAEHLRGLELLETRVMLFEALCGAAEFDLDTGRAAATCREAWSVFQSFPFETRSDPELVQDRLSLLLRQARLARDQGDAAMELELLDTVRAELPSGDPRALGMWQRLAVLAPDKIGMLDALERAFHASSQDQGALIAWVDALDDVGWTQLQEGDPEAAYATYQKALPKVVPWVEEYPLDPEKAFRALNAGLGISLAWVRSGESFSTLPELGLLLEVDIEELTEAGDTLNEPQAKLLSSVVERMGSLLPALSVDEAEDQMLSNLLDAFFIGAQRAHEVLPTMAFDSGIDELLAALERVDSESFTEGSIEFLRTRVSEDSRPMAFVRLAALLLAREDSTGLQLLDEWQLQLVEGDPTWLIAAAARLDEALRNSDRTEAVQSQLAEAEKCLQAAGRDQFATPEGQLLRTGLILQKLATASSPEADTLFSQLQLSNGLAAVFSVALRDSQERLLKALQGAVRHLYYSIDRQEEAAQIALQEISLRRARATDNPISAILQWDLGVALVDYSALARSQEERLEMFKEGLELRGPCIGLMELTPHDIADLGIDLADARALGIEALASMSPEAVIEDSIEIWNKMGSFTFPVQLTWAAPWMSLDPTASKRIVAHAIDRFDAKINAYDGQLDDWFYHHDLDVRRRLLGVAATLWKDDVEISARYINQKIAYIEAELDEGSTKWLEILRSCLEGASLLISNGQSAPANALLEKALDAHATLVKAKAQPYPYLNDALIQLAYELERRQIVDVLLALIKENAIEVPDNSLGQTLMLVAQVHELESSGAIEAAWRKLREFSSFHSSVYAPLLDSLRDQVGAMVIAEQIENPDAPALLCATPILIRQSLYSEAAQLFLAVEASAPESLAHLLDPAIAYARVALAVPEEKDLWDNRCLASLRLWIDTKRETLIQLSELMQEANVSPEMLSACAEDIAAIESVIKRAHEQEGAFASLRGTEAFERLFQ